MLDHVTSVSNLLKCHPERSYLIIMFWFNFYLYFSPSLFFPGNQKLHVRYIKKKKNGSLYVSGKLPTYPSSKPILTRTCHIGQNVTIGKG